MPEATARELPLPSVNVINDLRMSLPFAVKNRPLTVTGEADGATSSYASMSTFVSRATPYAGRR
jgi:hypothetical protein